MFTLLSLKFCFAIMFTIGFITILYSLKYTPYLQA